MASIALALTIHQTVSHITLSLGKALLVQGGTASLASENPTKYSANMRKKRKLGSSGQMSFGASTLAMGYKGTAHHAM
jgi:hypothetical protein